MVPGGGLRSSMGLVLVPGGRAVRFRDGPRVTYLCLTRLSLRCGLSLHRTARPPSVNVPPASKEKEGRLKHIPGGKD